MIRAREIEGLYPRVSTRGGGNVRCKIDAMCQMNCEKGDDEQGGHHERKSHKDERHKAL